MKYLVTMISILIISPLFAQEEEREMVEYDGGFDFNEGIYRNFDEFKMNEPYYKVGLIQDKQGNSTPEMWRENEVLYYPEENGELQRIDEKNVWGYCYRDAVNVQVNGAFERLVVVGSLCHFLGTATSYASDPFSYNGSSRQVVQQQYFIDMETGGTFEFNVENMSSILDRDEILFGQFEDVPKKKKKDVLFLYLRKYNERYPLYFPLY